MDKRIKLGLFFHSFNDSVGPLYGPLYMGLSIWAATWLWKWRLQGEYLVLQKQSSNPVKMRASPFLQL